jgi:hypothetical protein
MATDAVNSSYNVIGNREDLSDILTNISPTATPFFSSIGRTTAKSTNHEWQIDTLPTAVKTNAVTEGASATNVSASVTTRLGNRTQIFQNVVVISNTQIDGMNTAGRENEWAYQMKRQSMALARDIEMSLVQNSAQVSGTMSVTPIMEGLGLFDTTGEVSGQAAGWLSGSWIPGSLGYGVTGGTGASLAGRTALTETIFNDLLQKIWDNGGRPNMILVGGYLKRVISSFSANATRYSSITSGDKILSGSVSVYESDFGLVEMKLSNFVGATVLGAIETQYMKVAQLRGLTFSRLAKDGDRERGQFVFEATLAAYAPKSSGKITNLASAAGATAAFV